MKVIAQNGKNYLAEITATEVAKLKGFASLIAWRKAEDYASPIGVEVDIAQALAAVAEGTVDRQKIQPFRDNLAEALKRLDALIGPNGVETPDPNDTR